LEGIILKNTELVHQILKILQEWATHQNVEVKKNLIYNIPYLLTIFKDQDFLKELYIEAARDTDWEIRLVAMSSFHEIVKILNAREAQSSLREIFENIFKEEELKILEKVIPHLGGYVRLFQSILNEENIEVCGK